MNMMINEAPVGSGRGDRSEKQAFSEHNSRVDLHCMGDPAEWGWRRPAIEELMDERIAGLEGMLDDLE